MGVGEFHHTTGKTPLPIRAHNHGETKTADIWLLQADSEIRGSVIEQNLR